MKDPCWVFLSALLAASAQAGIVDDIVGKISFPSGFVINGTDAEAHAAPYIISLGKNYNKHAHICGGTIISKEWILTAAHCISEPVNMSALAGLHIRANVDERTQHRRIDFGRIHEQYTGGVGPFDIALLHVSEPFVFNDWVKPATLPSRGELHEGETHLYGWGQPKSYILSGAKTLKTVTTEIINYDECKELLPETAPLVESNVCCDSLKRSISACNGDSGGPLVVEHENAATELIGIVSWGYLPCGLANRPSVYTRVSAYLDWVAKIQSAYYILN